MKESRLRNLRNQSGLTQQEIADKLEISRANYSHIENGRNEPDNTTLVKIAKFFNVTTDYLLGSSDDPAKSKNDEPDLVANHLDKAYNELSPEEQAQVDNFIKFMKSNKKK
jgi:Predicted transcriptional regulators